MNQKLYNQPKYYEIAFSFVNPKKQVDNFEKLIKKFSKIKVKKFLDIACGPSLQLREIAKRGYSAIGLDLNPAMLKYLKNRVAEERLKIKTVKADMTNFKLKEKADFAFIMMGSFVFDSNEKLLKHLDSVAASLNRGGLYFIQNLSLDWRDPGRQSWIIEKDGIAVRTTYERDFKDELRQIYAEKLIFEINDNGKRKKIVQTRNLKFVFPQEFKTLLKLNGKFDFLGWWKGSANNWHFNQLLEKAKNLNGNFTLLRRK